MLIVDTKARQLAQEAFPVDTVVRNRHQAGMPGLVVGHLTTGQVVVEVNRKAQTFKAEHLERMP